MIASTGGIFSEKTGDSAMRQSPPFPSAAAAAVPAAAAAVVQTGAGAAAAGKEQDDDNDDPGAAAPGIVAAEHERSSCKFVIPLPDPVYPMPPCGQRVHLP